MQIEKIGRKVLLRQEREKEAVSLATQGRWEEAVEVNRSILDLFPEDMEALNRLGKALSELGSYSESREAFTRALQLSPTNIIAKKNLERLARLKEAATTKPVGGLQSRLFIEDGGKTCVTGLYDVAVPEVLATVAAGDPVNLVPIDSALIVQDQGGTYLGRLEPRLSSRLIRLIDGGNRYLAAVASVDEQALSVVIREEYQHPALAGVVSFPSQADHLMPYRSISEGELEDLEPEPAIAGEVGEEEEEVETGGGHVPKEDDGDDEEEED